MKKLKLLGYLLITIGIIAIIFGIRNSSEKYDVFEADSTEYKSIVVYYDIEDISYLYLDTIKIGDKIFDEASEKYIGEVIKVRNDLYEESLVKNDGTVVFAPIPNRHTIHLEVLAKVKISGDKILSEGGVEINSNSKHSIIGQKFMFTPVITNIEDYEG